MSGPSTCLVAATVDRGTDEEAEAAGDGGGVAADVLAEEAGEAGSLLDGGAGGAPAVTGVPTDVVLVPVDVAVVAAEPPALRTVSVPPPELVWKLARSTSTPAVARKVAAARRPAAISTRTVRSGPAAPELAAVRDDGALR